MSLARRRVGQGQRLPNIVVLTREGWFLLRAFCL